ncbi:MAG: tRNA glutamyl-Q(34) synthetase GluQRS [Micropepsaceae bacterium]
MVVTRFAPSPTGYLHEGHAFSALFAAASCGPDGRFLLRIEDIDTTRCRPEYEAAIYDDLAWLGLVWETPVRRQSAHFAAYGAALGQLGARGLTYPCFCTRREIAAEIALSAGAPQGPDGPLYPGTCRHLTEAARAEKIAAGTPYALRLDMARATAEAGPLTLVESGTRLSARPAQFGDAVLGRKETPASYHLAVTLDDAVQGVTLVTRGADLAPASHLHRLLQALLGLPEPEWRHHALLADTAGKRLAKRDNATPLRELKARGISPGDLRARLGFA